MLKSSLQGKIECPYCHGKAELIDSAEIFHRSFGPIWICRPCDARVGVHENSPDHAPKGTLANAELRGHRMLAHYYFDWLWKAKMRRDKVSRKDARLSAYLWLAEQMGIPVKRCHIGMFHVKQCQQVVSICQPIVIKVNNGDLPKQSFFD